MLLGLLINACLGLALGVLARERLRADGPFAAPSFVLVSMFAGLIVTPAALYLCWVHPAWSWLYLFDPVGLSAFWTAAIVLAQPGAVLGAWCLAALLIRSGRQRELLGTLAGLGITLAGATALLSGRLGAYGTHEQYAAGVTQRLMQVELGYVLIALGFGLVAAAAYVAIELIRDSRRARPR